MFCLWALCLCSQLLNKTLVLLTKRFELQRPFSQILILSLKSGDLLVLYPKEPHHSGYRYKGAKTSEFVSHSGGLDRLR